MKLVRKAKPSPPSNQNRQLSLPKLQSRILNFANNYQFSRLNFPIRDDSSLIGGVGRKHFLANSSSLQKIINPQYKQAKVDFQNNFYAKQRQSTEISRSNNLVENLVQKKLHTGYQSTKTLPAEPPFAVDYHSKNIQFANKYKDVAKLQGKRMQSQFNFAEGANNYSSEIIRSDPLTSSKGKIVYKQQAQTQTSAVFKKNRTKVFNPTYISSNL